MLRELQPHLTDDVEELGFGDGVPFGEGCVWGWRLSTGHRAARALPGLSHVWQEGFSNVHGWKNLWAGGEGGISFGCPLGTTMRSQAVARRSSAS